MTSQPTCNVKICGLSTPETVAAALEAGADRIGLVFFPRSPRHVTFAVARDLARQARGAAEVVALTVDADDALLEAVVDATAPDWLQCHGDETPERLRDIKALFGRPVIKAVGVTGVGDLERAAAYSDSADLILFDAKPPRGAALPGGNGIPFDWHILRPVTGPYMLSGGLSPDNVAEAIRISGARAVDVSSGVECAPGVKDAAKIRAFVAAAKGAALA